ncbi:MAG: hypothetical protein LUD72_04090 [Bacteroidales bacterium]|nr:hypothetical protein [Bacteroidales bacterium]
MAELKTQWLDADNPTLEEIREQLDQHLADYNNPHEVTKEQVGLGNVDNTADTAKPVSTALQEALDLKLTQNLYNSFERTSGIDDYTSYQWTAQSALVLYQTIESQLDFSSTEEDLKRRISALEAVLSE